MLLFSCISSTLMCMQLLQIIESIDNFLETPRQNTGKVLTLQLYIVYLVKRH